MQGQQGMSTVGGIDGLKGLLAEQQGTDGPQASEEQQALHKLKVKSRKLKVLGILSIIGGVIAASERDTHGLGDLAVIAGSAAIQAGIAAGREAQIPRRARHALAAPPAAALDTVII